MAKKFLTNIDMNKNQILNLVLHILGAAPSSPAEGQVYYDSGGHKPFWYNGSSWKDMTDAVTLGGATLAQVRDFSQTTGQRDHNAISDFDAQVRTSRLDQMAAPTANVSHNNTRITSLADPVNPQDAATKNYVDATVQGLTPKPSARAATTAALPANTYANGTSGVGATLTGNANGALTVDGVSVAVGDTVLVMNEATASKNGLYTVTATGDATHAYILTRHVDMDTAAEFAGAFIAIESGGTVNANTLWLATATGTVTVGTTSISFTQLNAATTFNFSAPLSQTGNTVSLNVAARLAIVGANLDLSATGITAGTYGSVTVDIYGRVTGATRGVGKYTVDVGDNASTSIAITQATHGLASSGVMTVQVFDRVSGDQVFPDINVNRTNGTVTVSFATAPTSAQYTVIIIG